jgi:hypothetical protein
MFLMSSKAASIIFCMKSESTHYSWVSKSKRSRIPLLSPLGFLGGLRVYSYFKGHRVFLQGMALYNLKSERLGLGFGTAAQVME